MRGTFRLSLRFSQSWRGRLDRWERINERELFKWAGSGRFLEMTWSETIERWRRLDEKMRQEICWERIPRQVALSMAFENEPVDLKWLQELHRQTVPPGWIEISREES